MYLIAFKPASMHSDYVIFTFYIMSCDLVLHIIFKLFDLYALTFKWRSDS